MVDLQIADTSRKRILVVDDVEINRLILQEILQDNYDIEQAADGYEAVSMMMEEEQPPDMVLLDIMMPEMDGFEVLSIMKNFPATSEVPVIFITASNGIENEIKGLQKGAVDYISKPFEPEAVKLRIDNYMELASYRRALKAEVEKKVLELTRVKTSMLEALAGIIEFRDIDSGKHTKRTNSLTRLVINQLQKNPAYFNLLNELQYEVIISAASMHDIGKIAVPDHILLKPGRLTPDEYEEIKKHSLVGGQIIESIRSSLDEIYYKHCHDICMYHHERWDGKGYPLGLKGKDIPLAARILAVVDVFDALVSRRPYKEAFSQETALGIIAEGAGTQFDPEIVQALLDVFAKTEKEEKKVFS